MRPAHPTMYGQPAAYVLPQNLVQYYAAPGAAPPLQQQYGRNPQQEMAPQGMAMVQQQPVYMVPQPQQPVMHPYPAVVGVPVQGVPAYGAAQAWAYRPAVVESAPVWGYGADRPPQDQQQQQQQQQQRPASNWQRAPQGAYAGYQGRVEGAVGFQGRGESHGNGAVGFQGRGESHGNGALGFQGRGEAHGNVFQGRGDAGKAGGEGRRFESGSGSRHYASGRQHGNRQGAPPQSPSPSQQAKQLGCEACEKSFAVQSQYTAHMNTHVQCDEIGCSFSASECEFLWSVLNVQSVNGCWSCAGKVVKEHKLTSHSKSSNPNPMAALKAASKLSEESSDEIKAWREERKRNYPTRLNIQRKKEVLEGKVARGELIDEDARKRRQRMKEILAKQAELGVPVAEVPSYYLSQPHRDDRARGRTGKQSDGSSGSTKRKIDEDADLTEDQPSKSARLDTELPPKPEDRDEPGTSQPSEKPPRTQCYFFQRGRCRKGPKCHFAHTRGKRGAEGEGTRKGPAAPLEKKRPPTLLSKLLQADITRDKSHILQCLRFFVNNNFLLNGIVDTQLTLESDAAEESSDYSEGEVVEAPDMLLADTAIINTLLSERPEVLAKVMEMETPA